MFANCHLHSTYSDGVYTPAQLASMARQVGHKALVLTDHDTVNGWPFMKAAAEKYGLKCLFFF